jgi:phage regulator Rha-like protein
MGGEMMISKSVIQSRIYTILGTQVMLDRDLAELYGVETKALNRAVKRNIERFPETFRYQLNDSEYEEILRFQNGTSSSHGGRRYLPYVFTEQGISMLSAVLRSPTAIAVSINIIETFVHMRKLLNDHATLLRRFERVEHRLLEHDGQFEKIFQAIEDKTLRPEQGIFFDGQIFDAHVFVSDLIKSAKKSIILIDNYIDESVLTLFIKNQTIDVTIYTHTISKRLRLDLSLPQ